MNDETMNDGDAEESESYDCTAHESATGLVHCLARAAFESDVRRSQAH